jgi:hypothetical protein
MKQKWQILAFFDCLIFFDFFDFGFFENFSFFGFFLGFFGKIWQKFPLCSDAIFPTK